MSNQTVTHRRNVSAHAFLTINGEPGEAMVFDLGDEEMAAAFLDEICSLIDGMVGPADSLTMDEPSYVNIEVRPMVQGFAASLPEHGGW